MLLEILKQLKIKLLTPAYFIVGNFRYYCYYTKNFFRFMIRKRIKAAICETVYSINKQCYNNAACKKCGCHVPKQNLGGKPCDCIWISLWNGKVVENILREKLNYNVGLKEMLNSNKELPFNTFTEIELEDYMKDFKAVCNKPKNND